MQKKLQVISTYAVHPILGLLLFKITTMVPSLSNNFNIKPSLMKPKTWLNKAPKIPSKQFRILTAGTKSSRNHKKNLMQPR